MNHLLSQEDLNLDLDTSINMQYLNLHLNQDLNSNPNLFDSQHTHDPQNFNSLIYECSNSFPPLKHSLMPDFQFEIEKDGNSNQIQKHWEEIYDYDQCKYLTQSNSNYHYQYTFQIRQDQNLAQMEDDSDNPEIEKYIKYSTPIKYLQDMGDEEIMKKKSCTCKKNGCKKKYCECFKAGQACGKYCQCQNCQNCQKYSDIYLRTRSRIRHEIHTQTKKKQSQSPMQVSTVNRCSCHKSGCKNNYCACRVLGLKCSSLCGCIECNNVHEQLMNQKEHSNRECENIIQKCLNFDN